MQLLCDKLERVLGRADIVVLPSDSLSVHDGAEASFSFEASDDSPASNLRLLDNGGASEGTKFLFLVEGREERVEEMVRQRRGVEVRDDGVVLGV